MKKTILYICLLINSLIMAQAGAVVITNAPTLEALESSQLKKSILQLQESAAQTIKMKESLDLLKDTKNLIDQVNSKITTSKQVYNTINKQVEVLQNITDGKKRMRKLQTIETDELNNVFNIYGEYVFKANELLQTINSLLTSGIFKMNDFERLEYINNISKELDELNGAVTNVEKRLTEVDRRRTIVNKF